MSELVDLSKLNPPQVIETLNYEQLLAERKQAFIELYPESEREFWRERLSLESEPITKLLEENCYLQLLERQRINSAAQATMLAYATGTDLDIIAANYNVSRKVIRAADDSVNPPLEEILETDTALRARTQLAFEGLSVAGPRNAYVYHALSAHAKVADVSVISPSPAAVTVTILSTDGQGAPEKDILDAVTAALNDDAIRPIGDRVKVQGAQIIEYAIEAKIYLYKGPESELVKTAALERVQAYAQENHRIGRDISLSGIYAAMHTEGVQRIELTRPAADIILTAEQASYCTAITIKTAVSDDY